MITKLGIPNIVRRSGVPTSVLFAAPTALLSSDLVAIGSGHALAGHDRAAAMLTLRDNAAAAGWESVQEAIALGAKTERERDWINALPAYYRDHDKSPVNTRLAAFTTATMNLHKNIPMILEAREG